MLSEEYLIKDLHLYAEKFNVYVFDYRKNIPENYTVKEIAEDVLFAMDELKIEKTFVFGASMGGMIGLELASLKPEKIKALCLGSTCYEIPEINKKSFGKVLEAAKTCKPEDTRIIA